MLLALANEYGIFQKVLLAAIKRPPEPAALADLLGLPESLRPAIEALSLILKTPSAMKKAMRLSAEHMDLLVLSIKFYSAQPGYAEVGICSVRFGVQLV